MSNTLRKICVVTGTRAEYGLLHRVIKGIHDSQDLKLQLVVTGMHLSPEFGNTVQEIEDCGFKINRKVEMLLSSDTTTAVTKSMGLALISFADTYNELRPDLLLILGDRFEIFAAATAALIARIPIAHIHGGEVTEGCIDESIRHSITKMSQLHFVAANEYRRRVIQLGEDPTRIFQVGGLGVDNILGMDLLGLTELQEKIGFNFLKRNLLVTFHPVTLEENTSSKQIDELLSALNTLKDTGLIFTMPNADPHGRIIIDKIKRFCNETKNARVYSSLGHLNYFSCIKYVDGVIGNSSSGLTEVPSFKKGTINIGDRQSGRLKATSVIDCKPLKESILEAIEYFYSSGYRENLETTINPYGNGGAATKIIDLISSIELPKNTKKKFHDLSFN